MTYFPLLCIIIVSGRQRRVSVQAMRQGSVPECIALLSFQEGLRNETSNRLRLIRPKENAPKAPAGRQEFLHVQKRGCDMDLLQRCACEFEKLIPFQYHIVVGRKGRVLDFTVSFDRADFHHLAGLHKLRDNVRFQTGKRSDITGEILAGHLTLSLARQSAWFHEMEPRLLPLAFLETFLDNNETIFHYNSKANVFSAIQADYLLENDYNGNPVYLFLAQRSNADTQVCRTFFPKAATDYTQGQPRYTLLKKEKHNMISGETIIQYDRLTPKM